MRKILNNCAENLPKPKTSSAVPVLFLMRMVEQRRPERLIPFDIVPRIISGREWNNLPAVSSSGFGRSTHFFMTFTTAKKFYGQAEYRQELIADTMLFYRR